MLTHLFKNSLFSSQSEVRNIYFRFNFYHFIYEDTISCFQSQVNVKTIFIKLGYKGKNSA